MTFSVSRSIPVSSETVRDVYIRSRSLYSAMLFHRRKIRCNILQCLDLWFFIIRQYHCFVFFHINGNPAFIFKAHLCLFADHQYVMHFRLEIKILTDKTIIDLVVFHYWPKYCVRCCGYLGRIQISCAFAVYVYDSGASCTSIIPAHNQVLWIALAKDIVIRMCKNFTVFTTFL